MSALFAKMELDEALKYCQKVGLQAIELPAGGYPGDPWKLSGIHEDRARLDELKVKITDAGLVVEGIAVHGNPVHPDPEIAKVYQQVHRNGVLLAAEFNTVVINFSGCPGGAPGDKCPNFVTCPWPEEFSAAAKYQWEIITSFWSDEAGFAGRHGVRIAFEAHPGMVVHTPEDIVRLHNTAGENLGGNFDPSHFWWQGIDPIAAVRFLGKNKCLFHFHAKDCAINSAASGICGNLDTKDYSYVRERGWVFCTVGYGHGDEFWKPLIRMLRTYGYDGVVSIEHEDSLMSMQEGFEKAVAYLKPIILTQDVGKAWWFKAEK